MNLTRKKWLNGLALSMLCLSTSASFADTDSFSSASAQSGGQGEIAPFTPFDLEAATEGYIVKGKLYSAAGIFDGTMVIDNPNKRVAFVFPPLGTFITTTTDSYNLNIPNTGGACLKYAGFGYAAFVDSFKKITSTPGATEKEARFTGYTKDSFSCNQNITFTFIQKFVNAGNKMLGGKKIPVITELDAALPGPAGPTTCRQGQAYFVSDLKTLDTKSNRDSYFVLPANCATPVNYCQAAYPPGNACAIDCPTNAAGKKVCSTDSNKA